MSDTTKKFTVKLEGNTGQFSTSFTSAAKSAEGLGSKLGGATKQVQQWTEVQQRAAMQMSRTQAEALKLNRTLDATRSIGGRLGEAFKSLTSGGGISGAFAAIGPAGIAAAAGIGAVTIAAKGAYNAVADLAQKAEGWSNVAEATGISVESVQKLQDYLEDAGFSADDLGTMMKKLQNEIATGGKEFERYGISLAQIRILAPEEQLRAVAAAVASIEDPTIRAAAATEFFGKTGAEKYAAIRGIAEGAYKVYLPLIER